MRCKINSPRGYTAKFSIRAINLACKLIPLRTSVTMKREYKWMSVDTCMLYTGSLKFVYSFIIFRIDSFKFRLACRAVVVPAKYHRKGPRNSLCLSSPLSIELYTSLLSLLNFFKGKKKADGEKLWAEFH